MKRVPGIAAWAEREVKNDDPRKFSTRRTFDTIVRSSLKRYHNRGILLRMRVSLDDKRSVGGVTRMFRLR